MAKYSLSLQCFGSVEVEIPDDIEPDDVYEMSREDLMGYIDWHEAPNQLEFEVDGIDGPLKVEPTP